MTRGTLDAHVQDVLDDIAILRQLDPRVVAAIVGEGVFCRSDKLAQHHAVEKMAALSGAENGRKRLETMAKALNDCLTGSKLPIDGHGRKTAELVDEAYDYACSYARGGYLVGIAVGMALASGQPFAAVTDARPSPRASRR